MGARRVVAPSVSRIRPDSEAMNWRYCSGTSSVPSPYGSTELWVFSMAGSMVFSMAAGSMVIVTVKFFFSPGFTVIFDGRENSTPGMSVLPAYEMLYVWVCESKFSTVISRVRVCLPSFTAYSSTPKVWDTCAGRSALYSSTFVSAAALASIRPDPTRSTAYTFPSAVRRSWLALFIIAALSWVGP